LSSTDIFISTTYLPNTSLLIAIFDAICFFTSRQPMSSGAITSAGQAKKVAIDHNAWTSALLSIMFLF
jgi:hypothetical protein